VLPVYRNRFSGFEGVQDDSGPIETWSISVGSWCGGTHSIALGCESFDQFRLEFNAVTFQVSVFFNIATHMRRYVVVNGVVDVEYHSSPKHSSVGDIMFWSASYQHL
jgi:hypothetical protein